MDRDPETVYRRERDGLLRFAFLLARDQQVAEDAVADAVARAWPKLRRGRIEDPGRYLRRAVANRLIDRERHRRVVERVESRRVAPEPRSLESVAVDKAIVVDALDRLTPGQRAVVVCRFYSGMTIAETARTLDVSVGTVKSRMSRALDALRSMLVDREAHGERDTGEGDTSVVNG